MHGLVNRSLQCFLQDTYGASLWNIVRRRVKLEECDLEAMLVYPDSLTTDILAAACEELGRRQDELLEDLGTYLVTHPNMEAVRRLLRFGGHTFDEFLYSLDDLHDRLKLAVPDLDLPQLETREFSATSFGLICRWPMPGFGAVLLGILRALADDYGALVLLELDTRLNNGSVIETVRIDVLEAAFASGRDFSLTDMAIRT